MKPSLFLWFPDQKFRHFLVHATVFRVVSSVDKNALDLFTNTNDNIVDERRKLVEVSTFQREGKVKSLKCNLY